MHRGESAEFLNQGATPFALAACEKFIPQLVAGHYDKANQTWAGGKDIATALTLTLTATPGDNDNDQD